MSSRRLGALALATALSSAALAVPTATAATDGSAAVISEVYGGGGEVLHGVSGQVNWSIGGVIELDEVMGEGSALIAASPVDL